MAARRIGRRAAETVAGLRPRSPASDRYPPMIRSPSRRRTRLFLASLLLATAGAAAAQAPPVDLRSQVDGARLGAGYAQLIGLAATPDIAAASYTIDSDADEPTIDVFRLPYQARWTSLGEGSDLYWRVAGAYLRLRDDFATPLPLPGGSIDSRWTAYSASGGLLARIALGNGFSVEPALDVGVARLENDASYGGTSSFLRPLLDGLLFNWRSTAWLVTPSIALGWSAGVGSGTASVRGHVARAWIGSFDESDPVQAFDETANVYSIRAHYTQPTGHRIAGRALSWVVSGGYAGFFGANRDALGFTSIAEIGAGVELPIDADRPGSDRLRLAAGYLVGPDVRGWTIGLSVPY